MPILVLNQRQKSDCWSQGWLLIAKSFSTIPQNVNCSSQLSTNGKIRDRVERLCQNLEVPTEMLPGRQSCAELTRDSKWLIVFLESRACLESVQPEVAGLLKRDRTTKGERQRKGEREKKKNGEVGIDIYTVSATNQVYYLLAQELHAKIVPSDADPQCTWKESQALWWRDWNTEVAEPQTQAFHCCGGSHQSTKGRAAPGVLKWVGGAGRWEVKGRPCTNWAEPGPPTPASTTFMYFTYWASSDASFEESPTVLKGIIPSWLVPNSARGWPSAEK